MALRLTAELNRGKCGRVSFMPLNRMRPPEVKYPEQVRWAALGALGCAVHAFICRAEPACLRLLQCRNWHLPAALLPPPACLQYGSDVVPLLKKLKYDPKFEPAFRQVGGCVLLLHQQQHTVVVAGAGGQGAGGGSGATFRVTGAWRG